MQVGNLRQTSAVQKGRMVQQHMLREGRSGQFTYSGWNWIGGQKSTRARQAGEAAPSIACLSTPSRQS